MEKYNEIFRLKDMLEEAGIEYVFVEEDEYYKIYIPEHIICIYKPDKNLIRVTPCLTREVCVSADIALKIIKDYLKIKEKCFMDFVYIDIDKNNINNYIVSCIENVEQKNETIKIDDIEVLNFGTISVVEIFRGLQDIYSLDFFASSKYVSTKRVMDYTKSAYVFIEMEDKEHGNYLSRIYVDNITGCIIEKRFKMKEKNKDE